MTGGIFAILDDIAMLMDDSAAVTKIAIKKTTALLGDDLAVGAQKAADFHASRELPVLWEITKGSFKNKLILLPVVFLLSFFAPYIIPYILILGGLYLSYEGAEKIYEVFEEKILKKEHHETKKVLDEKTKIRSAILTDLILSIEIIVIAFGTVLNQPLMTQIFAVSIVAIFATVGVYGIVALLVRMDDVGYYFINNSQDGSLKDKFGKLLVASLPKVIKLLSIVGTIAMLLVAGGILLHNISYIHHFYEVQVEFLPSLVFEIILSLVVGAVLFFIEFILHKIYNNFF